MGGDRVQDVPQPGDQVEYLGDSVFDLMIVRGDLGRVTRVEAGWVHAIWPRTPYELSVPLSNVRLLR